MSASGGEVAGRPHPKAGKPAAQVDVGGVDKFHGMMISGSRAAKQLELVRSSNAHVEYFSRADLCSSHITMDL